MSRYLLGLDGWMSDLEQTRRKDMSKLRIRHGDQEIEIEGANPFIKKQLNDFYKKIASLPARTGVVPMKQTASSTAPKAAPASRLSPAEFYKKKAKGKTGGVSKILIFGKYLEECRDQSEFSGQDINKVAKEARLAKDVHTQYFTNAVKQGLLRAHGHGRYSLTLSAESVVAAM